MREDDWSRAAYIYVQVRRNITGKGIIKKYLTLDYKDRFESVVRSAESINAKLEKYIYYVCKEYWNVNKFFPEPKFLSSEKARRMYRESTVEITYLDEETKRKYEEELIKELMSE